MRTDKQGFSFYPFFKNLWGKGATQATPRQASAAAPSGPVWPKLKSPWATTRHPSTHGSLPWPTINLPPPLRRKVLPSLCTMAETTRPQSLKYLWTGPFWKKFTDTWSEPMKLSKRDERNCKQNYKTRSEKIRAPIDCQGRWEKVTSTRSPGLSIPMPGHQCSVTTI